MSDIENLSRALCKTRGAPPESWQAYEAEAGRILEQMRRLQPTIDALTAFAICADTHDYVDLSVGITHWHDSTDTPTVQDDGFRADDYRVAGEVWRVHKIDPDPFPSRPHAHCIDGARTVLGCKLHLGNAQLYRGRDPLGRRLPPKHFNQLLDQIRPKFPGLTLPLPH
jgi:hypothetical protein